MAPPDIQLLLLDLGNVVVHLDFQRTLEGLFPEDPIRQESFRKQARNWAGLDRFERGLLSPTDFFQEAVEAFQIPVSYERFRSAWNACIVQEVPGLAQLLTRVSVPVDALSNTNILHIEDSVLPLPIAAHFRTFHTSYGLQARKPEAVIYERALSRSGALPHQTLFIDDLPENVAAASELGMHSVQLQEPKVDQIHQIFTDFHLLN